MRLGEEDREEMFTHDQIIKAVNKMFEDGHQYWVFKDLVGNRKAQFMILPKVMVVYKT